MTNIIVQHSDWLSTVFFLAVSGLHQMYPDNVLSSTVTRRGVVMSADRARDGNKHTCAQSGYNRGSWIKLIYPEEKNVKSIDVYGRYIFIREVYTTNHIKCPLSACGTWLSVQRVAFHPGGGCSPVKCMPLLGWHHKAPTLAGTKFPKSCPYWHKIWAQTHTLTSTNPQKGNPLWHNYCWKVVNWSLKIWPFLRNFLTFYTLPGTTTGKIPFLAHIWCSKPYH